MCPLCGFHTHIKDVFFSLQSSFEVGNWLKNAVGDKDKLSVRACLKPNSGCYPGGSVECSLYLSYFLEGY